MYDWYRRAFICYVHLSDVFDRPDSNDHTTFISNLTRSNWFTRGWTLQELLAPVGVVFCNANWEDVGHIHRYSYVTCDRSLTPNVADITGIPVRYLNWNKELRNASIAQRMSWAANRRTTRLEDEAYCLLGVFEINMPLLYGEGRKAFIRLQEEIIKRSTDQSILAWNTYGDSLYKLRLPVLADSPQQFPAVDERKERCLPSQYPYAITNKGIEMRADLFTSIAPRNGLRLTSFFLNYSRNDEGPVRIILRRSNKAEQSKYDRYRRDEEAIHAQFWAKGKEEEETFYLRTQEELVDQDLSSDDESSDD